jgi:hypothetical protein
VTVALGLLLAAPTLGVKVFHQRTGHAGRSAPPRRGQRKP